jgi:zinc transport system permease protein
MLELLQLPFVQRALIAGLILSVLTAVMGVLTLMRKAAFYGDAIAHSSLAGVAIGLMFGWYPLGVAFIYASIIAMILPWLKENLRINLDNILGIILPTSMGAGVIIFSLLPGFQPNMMSFLFGNILTIKIEEIYLLLGLATIAGLVFFRFLPKLVFTSLDSEYATLLGLKIKWLEKIYEVLLAITIVAGVKLLGVILINALLIIPASAARNLAKSLKTWLIWTVIISVITMLGGIFLSVILNTPPGATIAVFSGVIFVLTHLWQKISQG